MFISPMQTEQRYLAVVKDSGSEAAGDQPGRERGANVWQDFQTKGRRW